VQLAGEVVIDENAEALGALFPHRIDFLGLAGAPRHDARGGSRVGG
jgi:hypothetical protein